MQFCLFLRRTASVTDTVCIIPSADGKASCAEPISSQTARSQGSVTGLLLHLAWHGPEHVVCGFIKPLIKKNIALDTANTPFSSSSTTPLQNPPLPLPLSLQKGLPPPTRCLSPTPAFPKHHSKGLRWLLKLQGGPRSHSMKLIFQPPEQSKYLRVFRLMPCTSDAVKREPLSQTNQDLLEEMSLDRANVLSQSFTFSCSQFPSQETCCSSRLLILLDIKKRRLQKYQPH